MYIVWIVGSAGEARLAIVAAEVLKAQGVEISFASEFSETVNFLRQSGWPATPIADQLQPASEYGEAAIERIDRAFPEPGIHLLAFAEARARRKEDIESFHPLVAQHLDYWSKDFGRRRPDAVVSWQSGSLSIRAPLSVARALGIKTLIFVNGATLGRAAIADMGESENWTELVELNERTKNFSLSAADAEMARAHIREILELHSTFQPRRTPIWPGGLLRPTLSRLWQALSGKVDDSGTSLIRVNWQQYWERLCWGLKLKFNILKYHNLDRSERYVYFPMQNLVDVKLTGRNPLYADQVALAESIALAMRPGLTLYVREHPNHPGMYNFKRLKRLTRNPRVKLIHPHNSNIELVRYAAAVVCVNSTAGWEAYVNQVPVVVLGNPFFRRSRLVFEIDNLNDLSLMIRRAVDAGSKLYSDRADEWLWFIWASLATCAPGHPFGYKKIFNSVPEQDMQSNGRLIGKALLSKLQRINSAASARAAV